MAASASEVIAPTAVGMGGEQQVAPDRLDLVGLAPDQARRKRVAQQR
ncbi:MAG: hypothetical protein V9G14_14500 [Cypionkella sp.]